MYYKEEIYNELFMLNRRLEQRHLFLNLTIVGGAALIFNDIETIETTDIDTITRLEDEVREICESCSIDINDDALDYIKNYEDCEFINDTGRSFSNINIQYLTLGDTIKTKIMNYQDEDKAEKLRYLLEDELEVEMTVDGITEYLDNLGTYIDSSDIENFLDFIGY